ncbi:hypothetical protein D2T32_16510 [Sinirhodobacter populi]|nr:hypothetical protein D2T32_16510 [Sinirhodobacter populi]
MTRSLGADFMTNVMSDTGNRSAFEPLDLMRVIAGMATIGPQTHWEDNARRLVRILVAGPGGIWELAEQ